jgi:DNA-binding NtrC family response regulator
MPRMDGIALLKRLVAERPETSVLLTTAFASVETAVDALRLGAFDYLLKPVAVEDLLLKLQHLVAFRAMKSELGRLRRATQGALGLDGLVGQSPKMKEVFALVEKVAPTRSVVLVLGESGTGKELVARAIHARSEVADKEFLGINMAAVPQELAESILFGHEKGAFTGADKRKEGLLRSVRGGTIFLDEIGDLPLPAQAKLLRALELREILPVGAERAVPAEFRLVAATHQDLAAAVAQGRFRQDLYFRLNVFHITLPPLRDRRDDIPALVNHFLRLHAVSLRKPALTVSNQAMKQLVAADWPGNVRELSNVLERAAILAGDRIEVEHLPAPLHGGAGMPTELKPAVERFSRQHIEWVLRLANDNREEAARLLGIDPATLYRRLARQSGE